MSSASSDDDDVQPDAISALLAAANGSFGKSDPFFQAVFGDIEAPAISESEADSWLDEQALAALICAFVKHAELSGSLKGVLREICLALCDDSEVPWTLRVRHRKRGRRRSLKEVFMGAREDVEVARFVLRNDEFGRESAVSAAEAEFALSRSAIYGALARVSDPDRLIGVIQQRFFNTFEYEERFGPPK